MHLGSLIDDYWSTTMTKFSSLANSLAKPLSIAAATLLLAAPLTSQADNHDAAMDSCINVIVASANLPKEQRVTVRKEDAAATPLSVHARSYKIVVNAKGAESGKYFARGTCTVDRSGAVIALNGKPLSTQLTAAR
jgi:hypothetical protein